jgi:light-regulated signal transduction histidine kinase (bacteriophytochrome)
MLAASAWAALAAGCACAAACTLAWQGRRRAASDRRQLAQARKALAEQAERFDDVEKLAGHLMDNAAKFSRGRRVCRMEFTERREAGCAILSLSDDGVGFPAEHAHRLFKPFQRLHAQKRFTGTGIGLAIVERIATLHGGAVSGRNREAVGAVFEVKLPLVYGGEGTTAAERGSR